MNSKHEIIMALIDELMKHDLEKSIELIREYRKLQSLERDIDEITF